jgi:hypothetical protein
MRQKSQKKSTENKSSGKPFLYGYIYYTCDTCGVSQTEPEFKGQVIITTHPIIHLNASLIQYGYCTADTAQLYEKKSYLMYLESEYINKN